MDVVREKRRSRPIWALAGIAIVIVVPLTMWAFFASNDRGGPVVERGNIVTDVVRRGTIVRTVSGQGTFVPELVRVISATQGGVVNQVFVKPGTLVATGTVVAQMQNPTLDAAAADARAQLAVAGADLASAREQARAEELTQQTNLADAEAQMEQSALQARSLGKLHGRGLVADVAYQQAVIASKRNTNDVRIQRAQLDVATADAGAKVAAAQARVDEAAAQFGAAEAQVAALTVRSSSAGIVQSVGIDPGTSVAQNAEIARVADTRSLKVVLQIAEGDVRSVAAGMSAAIDAGSDVLQGRVSRIAPAASNGTVGVDVVFGRALPANVRPDSNVAGSIFLSSIQNALSIARPVGASDGQTIALFKVIDGGAGAVRGSVRLGQGSSERVAIDSGLSAGDLVIISDMSNYSDQNVLRLR